MKPELITDENFFIIGGSIVGILTP